MYSLICEDHKDLTSFIRKKKPYLNIIKNTTKILIKILLNTNKVIKMLIKLLVMILKSINKKY